MKPIESLGDGCKRCVGCAISESDVGIAQADLAGRGKADAAATDGDRHALRQHDGRQTLALVEQQLIAEGRCDNQRNSAEDKDEKGGKRAAEQAEKAPHAAGWPQIARRATASPEPRTWISPSSCHRK
ncbi:hypothetical protein [Jiella pelagia]|uniref:Uncharacterized protein n=1 Tax=Jiella pelagia TaxID=2986949 RepID=A0ABY7C1Z6_9HYPH|nr:hypothetical protein [Jiella pelagia]WAP68788.1 hypothetical protein OH818_26690 [Jiella pelagia]